MLLHLTMIIIIYLFPYPIYLTLPTSIIHLPKHLHFVCWYEKYTKCLITFKATDSETIMHYLKDLQKQLKESKSFGNSIKELEDEFLVQSSRDCYYDDLMRHIRSLGSLPQF